ncbi:alpha/beta-hydrolase [Polyplosphaeria fusca]|uniref:Alpha/beta-hydrolase n=1 Tax=Polyplosphaeria fusca TaxID=682080 RepID=A0A9P4QZ86_9PLEO|nr:alpha/beta-hydrolase [Polyplosphaeria fusca]
MSLQQGWIARYQRRFGRVKVWLGRINNTYITCYYKAPTRRTNQHVEILIPPPQPSMSNDLVLPRPGDAPTQPRPPIPAPSEKAFTDVFGALLPPAQYLQTSTGRAAYYTLAPLSPSPHPPRILLLHGVQTPALGLLPLTLHLRSSRPHAHFLLLDLWGHGLSETPIAPHEPALFHSLIDALLTHLAWPSAHLIGYSFGANLVVGYAVSRPERVQSFALVAPAGLIPMSMFDEEGMRYLVDRDVDEGAVREWVVRFLEGGDMVVPGDWRERVSRGEVVAQAVKEWQMRNHAGHGASVVGIVRDGRVVGNEGEFGRAAGLGVQNVVVLGSEDSLSGKEKFEELGFGRVVVVEGAGHGVVRDRPVEVAAAIQLF